jgi:hypothetical protein
MKKKKKGREEEKEEEESSLVIATELGLTIGIGNLYLEDLNDTHSTGAAKNIINIQKFHK